MAKARIDEGLLILDEGRPFQKVIRLAAVTSVRFYKGRWFLPSKLMVQADSKTYSVMGVPNRELLPLVESIQNAMKGQS